MNTSPLKKISLATCCSIGLLGTGIAQAAPIIAVSTDELDVSYFVETTVDSVTTVHSDSSSGSMLGGGEEVTYSQFYIDSDDDESYIIDLRAAGYAGFSNSFNLDAEATDYYYGTPGAFPTLDDVGDLYAQTTLSWEFSVLDEDVGFWGGIFNEEDPFPRSIAELGLYDVTAGSSVLSLNDGFGNTDEITLFAGHDYILTAIASDNYHDDEATYVSFRFDDDAIITSTIPEPGTASILLTGIAGIFAVRKRRQRQ